MVKWREGEEEEAEVVAATQKRTMLCKPEEVASLVFTVCSSLSLSFLIHLAAFAGVTKFSRMGDHSPEPVDETMSGNKFHYKNK